jgi:hypothetical protein
MGGGLAMMWASREDMRGLPKRIALTARWVQRVAALLFGAHLLVA